MDICYNATLAELRAFSSLAAFAPRHAPDPRVRVKVWAVAAVPGGVASGGADSAVRLWTSTLEPRGTLGTHTTWVVCLCWGGTELLSSSGAERGFERVFF